MDPTTVIVAAMGFASTLLGAWLAGRSQRRGALQARMLEAKLRVYGECSDSLFEYQRAAYNRVKARIEARPDREPLRQEAYRSSSRARSAIGQVAILTGDEDLSTSLEAARVAITAYNDAMSEKELQVRQRETVDAVEQALRMARADLTRRGAL